MCYSIGKVGKAEGKVLEFHETTSVYWESAIARYKYVYEGWGREDAVWGALRCFYLHGVRA